jgi:hypothetical protein
MRGFQLPAPRFDMLGDTQAISVRTSEKIDEYVLKELLGASGRTNVCTPEFHQGSRVPLDPNEALLSRDLFRYKAQSESVPIRHNETQGDDRRNI